MMHTSLPQTLIGKPRARRCHSLEQKSAQASKLNDAVGLTLQRHLMALLKLAPVESRFCSCKRRGEETFDTPINPCARSTCSRSVAVGLNFCTNGLAPFPLL